ncbi:OsmC family protein [Aeromonas caviae]|uniref:OsmC family protein n=1 Tax=Aeromonas caviae TaxID=648 RepID=UPI002B4657C6|nr:OsmC family protein [Aeromonas caviae]
MSEYSATISWQRGAGEPFVDQRYSRAHEWAFDGGVRVPASSSPHVVPLPYSVAENVDPEEAFVAALSSCHMLTFLWLAAKAGYLVERYRDEAVGIMAKNGLGRLAMTAVTLRPRVVFGGEHEPTYDELAQLHHQAHEECFIANSVNTVVTTEIVV